MKNIRIFLPEKFPCLVVKFSIYLDFVMAIPVGTYKIITKIMYKIVLTGYKREK